MESKRAEERRESGLGSRRPDKESKLSALVEKTKQGDNDALIALCQLITKDILYSVTRILRNHADAEDVTQEILIRVCTKIHGLKNPQAFNAWLSRIVINETNRYFEKAANRIKSTNIDDYQDTVEEENEEFLPQAYISNKQNRDAVVDAIQKLPVQQRKVIVLHYFDGLRVSEIAKVMRISRQSISEYLKQAQKRIRKELLARSEQFEMPDNTGFVSFGVMITQAMCGDAIETGETQMLRILEKCEAYVRQHGIDTDGNILLRRILAGWKSLPGIAATSVVVTSAVVSAVWAGGALQQAEPESDITSCEAGYAESAEYRVDGEIIFVSSDENYDDVNPERARVWAIGTYGALEVQHWSITRVSDGAILYVGKGDIVDTVLIQMREREEYGVYSLQFVMIDTENRISRASRQFIIQQCEMHSQFA